MVAAPTMPTGPTGELPSLPIQSPAPPAVETAPAAPSDAAQSILPPMTGMPGRDPTRPDLSGPGVRLLAGSWRTAESEADQLDGRALYAKLVIPVEIPAGPVAYEFTARSAGSGWVGFGMHIHGRGQWRMTDYGGGDSVLVWITSDPARYGDADPRLQVYRSRGEVDQSLQYWVRLGGSAYEDRLYRIEYDPAAGALRVLVDGVAVLDIAKPSLAVTGGADFVALRALDRAEFTDVRIVPADQGGQAAETGHE